ncbi:hypothetical protein EYF80_042320 [Liparis tanakae]|uniref:Uncharacterized protein n=1 Tax=Liparis tanakae TaxID=230148 RepID=A0A4Z2G1S0_9TELE|nr:hypothetical protein EYF80_042320 [Liparis tanakae]
MVKTMIEVTRTETIVTTEAQKLSSHIWQQRWSIVEQNPLRYSYCLHTNTRKCFSEMGGNTIPQHVLPAPPSPSLPPAYGSGSWLLLAALEPLCFARFGTRQLLVLLGAAAARLAAVIRRITLLRIVPLSPEEPGKTTERKSGLTLRPEGIMQRLVGKHVDKEDVQGLLAGIETSSERVPNSKQLCQQ